MKRCLITILIFFITGSFIEAKGVFKRYPVKSGMIFYDIHTNGKSKNFTTETTGIARLVFDKWGAREMKEEDVTQKQTGDFNETNEIHTMSMIDNGTIYTVDYNERNIYKTRDRSLDLAIAEHKDISNQDINLIKEMKGQKVGTDTVEGFKCDVWKIKDQKICLYKGIPLKITIDDPGFHSEKKAVSVVFNQPIPKDEFKLPKFPVIIDQDYTSNASAETQIEDYLASIHDLKKKMKSIGINPNSNNQTLTPEQEKEVINTLGARYLQKQKYLLPKLMTALKNAKECINDAKDANNAKECIEPVNKIDEKLGDKTENFDFSKFPQNKPAILKSLTNELSYLKVTNACVQKYNRTTDVILCTEGNLGEDESPQNQTTANPISSK